MKRYLPLLFCIALAGCGYIRGLFRRSPIVEDDTSIVFPQFFEQAPVEVGRPGQIYQLDGALLKAIAIAANDFLPVSNNTSCEDKQESHTYRAVRQGDIVFVRIDENPEACGHSHISLDSGIRYAIRTDGRILRRIVDGTEAYVGDPDASTMVPGEPGISSSFDPEHSPSPPFMRHRAEDGGMPAPPPHASPNGSSEDGG